MALNQMGLGFVFTAKDLASGVMQKLDRNFRQLDDVSEDTAASVGRAFSHMAKGAAMMAAGGFALNAMSQIADVAGKFEAAVRSAGLIAGASAEEMRAFEEASIDAGINTQFSPTEAAKGLEALASSGLNARQAIEALNPTLMLAGASLGQLSVEDAGGLASQALNVFQLQAKDTGEVVNKLTQLANQSSVAFGNMNIGLGNIARGANAMHQSLDTTLITLGLVKGVIPRIDSAATAASVAMERMVNPKYQGMITGLGVKVADADGNFRDFLDIVVDLQAAMAGMDEATKSATLLEIFGQEGLAGVQAVFGALDKGVEDATGSLVKGAAAVDVLRKKMAGAADSGVAAQFQEEMLRTFEGQKTLLRGSMETFAIVIGKPLAEVFAPIVKFVTDRLNQMIAFFKGLSPRAQKTIATFAAVGSALLAVAGAVLVVKGALVAMQAVGISSGAGFLAALAPALPVILAIGAAALALKIAWDENFGGIQETVKRAWEVLKLFGEGVYQLFSQGGFSGEVQKALGAPENAGLKEFLIDLYQDAYRVYKFFLGVWEGFSRAIDNARPAFIHLGAVLGRVWGIVETLGAALFGAGAAVPSDEFRSWGDWLGNTLGRVLEFIVRYLAMVIDFFVSMAEGVIAGITTMAPFLEFLFSAFGRLWTAVTELIGAIFGFTEEGASAGGFLSWLGETAGWLAGILVGALAGALGIVADILAVVVRVITAVVEAFVWVADKIGWIVEAIFGASEEADGALAKVDRAAKKHIANQQDSDGSGAVQKALDAAKAQVPAEGTGALAFSKFQTDLSSFGLSLGGAPIGPTRPAAPNASVQPKAPMQSVVTDAAGNVKTPSIFGGLPQARAGKASSGTTEMKKAFAEALKESGLKEGMQATVVLQLDGETLAKAQVKTQRNSDIRSFKSNTFGVLGE